MDYWKRDIQNLGFLLKISKKNNTSFFQKVPMDHFDFISFSRGKYLLSDLLCQKWGEKVTP